MVKIEHTIFALPFAFLGAFLAAGGFPRPAKIGWILLAMVGARSAAMAFNRLVDLPFDAKNPRTVNRALPQMLLTGSFVVAFIVASSAVLIFAASRLNNLSLALSPAALGIIFFYSYTKRFTWLAHIFLGISLACAPIGAWIAIRGSISWSPVVLGVAVALWVAGFDVIYSCQDVEFDRGESLYSQNGLALLQHCGYQRRFIWQWLGSWLFYSGVKGLAALACQAWVLWRCCSPTNTAWFVLPT
jgi:4-hydroxybenzoate polyprenyltransferase